MLFTESPPSRAGALLVSWFPVGCAGVLLLVLTGCAPKIHTAQEGSLQALDATSLEPIVGCYRYLSSSQTCTNCSPEPFFPFGEAGGPEVPVKSVSETQEPPDTVCLRAYEDGHVFTATSYRSGVAVRSQSYEGRARDDGYFVIDTTTDVDFNYTVVFWVMDRSRAALGVEESGALRQLELRTSGLFFVILPIFGGDFGTSARFEPAPDPRDPASPEPQVNGAHDPSRSHP